MNESRERTSELSSALSLANRFRDDARVPQPKCIGKLQYTEYVTPPTAEQARAMCHGCPLLKACRASALVERPAWGVQGGIVWVYGRQYHLRRTATYEQVEELEDIGELVEISAQKSLDAA